MSLRHQLENIDVFIFDLDDTLYPHGQFLTSQKFFEILNAYVAEVNGLSLEETNRISKEYLAQGIDKDIEDDVIKFWQRDWNFNLRDFNDRIDAVDISHMSPCVQTLTLLEKLPVRKVIFTNAHRTHAERMITHLGLETHIEHVCDYITRGQRVKPMPDIYHELVDRLNVSPEACVMVEDRHVNLRPAKAMGMHTVLVHPNADESKGLTYVDRHHNDVVEWLQTVDLVAGNR